MSSLIEELKKEHSDIITMLQTVNKMVFQTEEGRRIILSMQKRIQSHLEKENERLYPVIRKASETDERLKKTLYIIEEDMENVKESFLHFYNKFANSRSSFKFSKDYKEIIWIIRNRIIREEEILFKEYELLTG